MKVLTNDRLVRRETRIGGILLGITFCLLGVGMLLSFQVDRWAQSVEPWVPIVLTYSVVLVGMSFYYFGNVRIRRYGPRHRQDERLRQLLKGLDDRYVLYAFLGRKLPDYVLVGPNGVHVLTTRVQHGEISCRNDRWSRRSSAVGRLFSGLLYSNPMGAPSHETAHGVQRLREVLSQNLPADSGEPLVSGLIVFTADQVRLRVERCSFPVTTGKELRKVIGKLKAGLNQTQQAQLHAALESVRAA